MGSLCCGQAVNNTIIAPKIIGSDTILKTLFILFMGCVFEFQPQKYSKKTLFFQAQWPLQTFAKPLRWFITCCGFRLQLFCHTFTLSFAANNNRDKILSLWKLIKNGEKRVFLRSYQKLYRDLFLEVFVQEILGFFHASITCLPHE